MSFRLVLVALALATAPVQLDRSAAERVEAHIARLASDAMEGRAPGTAGGERAARYIAEQFETAGLSSELQPVSLVGHRGVLEEDELAIVDAGGARRVPLDEFAVWSDAEAERLELRARPLFVGYAVANADVRGRLVALFPGGAEGYRGRDEQKRDEALGRGALGTVFLRREPFDTRSYLRFERLTSGETSAGALAVGLDVSATALLPVERIEELERRAREPAALPIELQIELEIAHRQRVRRFSAPNVVGVVPGEEPASGNVLVTAHYDAYGVGPSSEDGDAVYNGALDNAAGAGALIELARHFASEAASGRALRRTLVFVATTAEEHGAIGMRHYVEHPVAPVRQTVVALNVDGVNVYGVTEDFIAFPSDGTAADGALRSIGARVGMRLVEESWQSGMHFSFDTWPLFERGVVGLTLWQGPSFVGLAPGELRARIRRFGRPHTPGDEWPGSGDREAIAQHLALYAAAIEHWGGTAPAPELSPPGLLAPATKGSEEKTPRPRP